MQNRTCTLLALAPSAVLIFGTIFVGPSASAVDPNYPNCDVNAPGSCAPPPCDLNTCPPQPVCVGPNQCVPAVTVAPQPRHRHGRHHAHAR